MTRVLSIIVLLGVTTALAAQQAPVFRTGIDLVQVDVVVLDRQGQPVRGLTKHDFRILDGSAPREVELFEEVAHARPERPFAALAAPDVADSTSAASDRLVVIVVDDLHFQQRTEEVKAIARRVVRELGDNASLAMIFTSFRPGVEFTQNRQALLEVIDAFEDKVTPQGRRLHPGLQMTNRQAGAMTNDPAGSQANLQVKRALQEAARLLAPEERRRKALVWISAGIGSGLHYDPGRADDMAFIERVSGRMPILQSTAAVPGAASSDAFSDYVLDELRRSNVAVYAIDPGGYGSHTLMQNYANGSGGFVVAPQDIDAGMGLVLDTLDHYYLLGFTPDARSGNGRSRTLRSIQVTATNPDLIVRSRGTYTDGPPPPLPKNDNPLVHLSASVMPSGALPLKVFAAPSPATRGEPRVAVALEVEGDAHLLPDTGQGERIDFAVLAVDLKKRKVTETSFQTATAIRPVDPSAPGRATYQVNAVLALPAGRYQLRASAISAAWGRGSVYLTLDIPDYKAETPLALGGLVVAVGARDDVAAGAPWGPFPFRPTLSRTWHSEDAVRVGARAQTRRGPAQAAPMRVEIVDANETVVRRVEGQTTATGDLDEVVSLAGLPAGAYLLRVHAGPEPGAATRALAFQIR